MMEQNNLDILELFFTKKDAKIDDNLKVVLFHY